MYDFYRFRGDVLMPSDGADEARLFKHAAHRVEIARNAGAQLLDLRGRLQNIRNHDDYTARAIG